MSNIMKLLVLALFAVCVAGEADAAKAKEIAEKFCGNTTSFKQVPFNPKKYEAPYAVTVLGGYAPMCVSMTCLPDYGLKVGLYAATPAVSFLLILIVWLCVLCCRGRVCKCKCCKLPACCTPMRGKVFLGSMFFLVICVCLAIFAGRSNFINGTEGLVDSLKMFSGNLEEYNHNLGNLSLAANKSAEVATKLREASCHALNAVSNQNETLLSAEAINELTDIVDSRADITSKSQESQINSIPNTDFVTDFLGQWDYLVDAFVASAVALFIIVALFGVIGLFVLPRCMCIFTCVLAFFLITVAICAMVTEGALSVILSGVCHPDPVQNFAKVFDTAMSEAGLSGELQEQEGAINDITTGSSATSNQTSIADLVKYYFTCEGTNPFEDGFGVVEGHLDTQKKASCFAYDEIEAADQNAIPTTCADDVAFLMVEVQDVQSYTKEFAQDVLSCQSFHEPLAGLLEAVCVEFVPGLSIMYGVHVAATIFLFVALFAYPCVIEAIEAEKSGGRSALEMGAARTWNTNPSQR